VLRLLCFQAGGQEFGAPIRTVKETLPERPLTRVFLVPPFVAGLMNLRGEVVGVLDLARLVGLPPVTPERERRRHPETSIVILRSVQPGKSSRPACGLSVERLLGVRDVADALQPPPTTLDSITAGYLAGVASSDPSGAGVPRPILVLDPERVLACDALRPYRRSAA
jgi:purine-binding chemotaxis protein CheW